MLDASSAWAHHIEVIESGYEFMLAYAAQGQIEEDPSGSVRQSLQKMNIALDDLEGTAEQLAIEVGLSNYRAFLDVMAAGAKKAQAGINLVLAKPTISSQLIDNLNSSIHLRALLTDLFLIDDALK
ncbi:MAG: hypothetical protein QGG64_19660 [Candidatus Latescibacteria bacterium]|nr:hypothetical protein [Candidatus Latescibacterota bacterium]